MPSLSELPDKINQDRLAKALCGLGFIISKKGGYKGSHVKLTCVKTQKMIILPANNLSKNTLYYIVKEIEKNSDVLWEDILKRL
ncbi:MAG: hypothetical protein US83_C0020G0010 [Candidatus Falkowbacteria bacterium GW2011_GWC2_38_22]|nr:MAG: hypothetical protein US83_C0020G0010 [Candidatus Falkowbacteria bacterium GW2011_GWC2_38_22]KKQ62367.1 MAG: hypothetical protein US84_C0018G0001 [Candidatus Falkowbacteria bacterium GW2011_GWF1_38_22]KKQ71573.1 MAG: hypothetical protein US93_C0017G0001 [Candidatus Falkowbacteria bacterium GW2011_GWD2_38_42]HAM88874.1 hypothetical protein [Candidatus Falkowbacteria bacterium]HAY12677.1 hypothetical protein [Candidatus Falkowbacteria bacterium]